MFFRYVVLVVLFLIPMLAQQDGIGDQRQKQKEKYLLSAQLEGLKAEQDRKQRLLDRNGFFLGGGIGSGQISQNQDTAYSILFALKGGYQKGFEGMPMGVRVYGEFDFLGIPVKPLNFYNTASVNLDITADFLLDKSFSYGIGFFAGVGFGGVYGYTDKRALGEWSTFLNFGVSAIMNIRHRIELSMRLPSTQKLILGQSQEVSISNLFLVNYLYQF